MAEFLSALVYALFSLDHFAVGPFLLSRPLGVASGVGVLCGHPSEAIALGFLAEFLWVAVPPAGGGQWDMGLSVGLAGVWALGRFPGPEVPGEVLAFAFTLAIPFAVLGRQGDQWIRRHMRLLSTRALAGVKRGLVGPLWYSLWVGAVVWGLKSLVIFFLAQSLGGSVFNALLPWVLGPWKEGLRITWSLWPFLGLASVLHHFSARRGGVRFLLSGAGVSLSRGVGEKG